MNPTMHFLDLPAPLACPSWGSGSYRKLPCASTNPPPFSSRLVRSQVHLVIFFKHLPPRFLRDKSAKMSTGEYDLRGIRSSRKLCDKSQRAS